MFERVVSRSFNRIKYCQPSSTEHLEIGAQKRFDGSRQRPSGLEDRSRARDQSFHQGDLAIVETSVNNVRFGQSVTGESVERNVDASFFEIA